MLDANTRAGSRWTPISCVEILKEKAREEGLWNFFLPGGSSHSDDGKGGACGLTNLEYAPVAELMGRNAWVAEVFNCNAPDSGNAELLERFGTDEQKARWLRPLLAGEIRSCFAMTEPDSACSDATNVATSIADHGDGHYVINGRKWWITGAGDPRCKLIILMGRVVRVSSAAHSVASAAKADSEGSRQSMVLVPMDTAGVSIERMLTVFGYDDAPHGHAEIAFRDVRVPAGNLLYEEGKGFEMAQARLGPGRIHHCMRAIGLAERSLERPPPGQDAARLRAAPGAERADGAGHCREPHGARAGEATNAQGGAHDGFDRQQVCAAGHRHDQGRGAADGPRAGRSRDPSARRSWRL